MHSCLIPPTWHARQHCRSVQVEKLQDKAAQEAEVLAFFGDFDSAADRHKRAGRADLAVQLFMRLGQWERAESLIKVRDKRECEAAKCCHILQTTFADAL